MTSAEHRKRRLLEQHRRLLQLADAHIMRRELPEARANIASARRCAELIAGIDDGPARTRGRA